MKKLLLTTLTTIALSSISTAHAEDAYVGADVLFGHYGLENSGVSSWNGGGETVPDGSLSRQIATSVFLGSRAVR